MTFTILPEATPLADLLTLVSGAYPYSGPTFVWNSAPEGEVRVELFNPIKNVNHFYLLQVEIWERNIVQKIQAILNSKNGHLVLVSDTRPKKSISPDILEYLQYSRLQYGLFSPLDYHLKALREYDGATIFVPDEFAEQAFCQLGNGNAVILAGFGEMK